MTGVRVAVPSAAGKMCSWVDIWESWRATTCRHRRSDSAGAWSTSGCDVIWTDCRNVRWTGFSSPVCTHIYTQLYTPCLRKKCHCFVSLQLSQTWIDFQNFSQICYWKSKQSKALVRWGGKIKHLLTAYFLRNTSAKKLSKSIHVCQSYSKTNSDTFFETQCTRTKNVHVITNYSSHNLSVTQQQRKMLAAEIQYHKKTTSSHLLLVAGNKALQDMFSLSYHQSQMRMALPPITSQSLTSSQTVTRISGGHLLVFRLSLSASSFASDMASHASRPEYDWITTTTFGFYLTSLVFQCGIWGAGFCRLDALTVTQPTASKHWRPPIHLVYFSKINGLIKC